MTSDRFTHFVFVDFENVPEVELGLVEGRPVRVTRLIGKNQTRLELGLVQQIHRLAAQVELVEVGASGRNALDLTLACHLGQAIERDRAAGFHIVSRDKDFEAMIGHLQRQGIKLTRQESFAALPFLPKPRKSAPMKAAVPAKAGVPVKTPDSAQAAPANERFEKLAARLENNSAPRPKKKSSLLAHINTVFGGKLAEREQERQLDELIRRGFLTLDAKDRVTYRRV